MLVNSCDPVPSCSRICIVVVRPVSFIEEELPRTVEQAKVTGVPTVPGQTHRPRQKNLMTLFPLMALPVATRMHRFWVQVAAPALSDNLVLVTVSNVEMGSSHFDIACSPLVNQNVQRALQHGHPLCERGIGPL